MSRSVFNGIMMPNNEILFVKRRDAKGSWYLPGGKIFPESSFARASSDSRDKLLEWTGDLSSGYMGHWNLSEEAGGFEVHLHRGELDYPETVKIYNGSENQYIQEIRSFSLELIKYHLYETSLIPWAQAKMAVCLLELPEFSKTLGASQHGLLKDDLGRVNGYDWHRPWILQI